MSSRNRPVWLRIETILAVHEAQIAEHGGAAGVRDRGLLESALERPKNAHAYGSPSPAIAALAAQYAIAIIRNHPFVDGNKRVGFVALELFLALNGLALLASDQARVDNIVRLAAGEHSDESFTAWVLSSSRKSTTK